MIQDRADPHPLALLKPHWRVVLAASLGWFLDAFDQVALFLCLPDMGHSLGVDLAGMGWVITAQSLGRVLGNTGWGWLADRYGRKLAFMAGVLWFAAFSGATAIAGTYLAMVAIQFAFGIGFGGEWTASAALLMESVPQKARALASAIMMAGYEIGFFCAAAAQALILPHFGWRAMFLLGLAPAILAIFVRRGVAESPVWLATRNRPRVRAGLFRLDGAAIQAIVFMALLQFQNAAMYAFYPSFLRDDRHFSPSGVFVVIAAYCAGSLIGKPICGWLATRFGVGRVLYSYLALTLVALLPYLSAHSVAGLVTGAFAMGLFGAAIWAIVPHFLASRFPSATRSFGMGASYASASLGQAVCTVLVPWLAHEQGLGSAIGGVVFCMTGLLGCVIAYRPESMPGAVMEGDAEA